MANLLLELLSERGLLSGLTVVDIGARSVKENGSPAAELLMNVPGSRAICFEPDEEDCRKENANCPDGMTYYPHAISGGDGPRSFYITDYEECSSLLEPNIELAEQFGLRGLYEMMQVDRKITVDTVTLDHFLQESVPDAAGQVDFVKMDVQGAELEIIQGSPEVFGNALCVIAEVEYVPLYVDQPLIGDVIRDMLGRGFYYSHPYDHAFGGRILPPHMPSRSFQHMWTDAVFLPQPSRILQLQPGQLLKLVVLANFVKRDDVVRFALVQYDQKAPGSDLWPELKRRCQDAAA
jgi:FkbM family methyltransferase